jgi:hypothetical protein
MADGLVPCPFYGGDAGIIIAELEYQIVGCKVLSMLCPNPRMGIFKDKNGNFNYEYWDRRAK